MEEAKYIPRQHQSVDCAVFVLEYEDRIQRSEKVGGFKQQDMKKLRLKLAIDIAMDGWLRSEEEVDKNLAIICKPEV